jgi:Cu/Ag efflux pump CusA
MAGIPTPRQTALRRRKENVAEFGLELDDLNLACNNTLESGDINKVVTSVLEYHVDNRLPYNSNSIRELAERLMISFGNQTIKQAYIDKIVKNISDGLPKPVPAPVAGWFS